MSDFDVFISYARKDNVPDPETGVGWVTSVREMIEQDARGFGTSLRVFLDTSEISFLQEWEQRIRGALRSSKVMLICVSPNYFASNPCKWEWDEFLLRRERLLSTMGGNGVTDGPLASVYLVETPGSDDEVIEAWRAEVNRTHRLDLIEWFPHGARELQREEVRSQLRAMGDRVADRVHRARVIELSEGNVRASTEYFVGRVEPMRQIREAVYGPAGIGVVTAIHAMGGIGKTELAVTYANQNRDHYTGGVWFLEAEGYESLLPLLARLAQDSRFGWEPPRDANPERVGIGVLVELQRRAREVGPTLLLADNVSSARLLSPSQLAPLRLGQTANLSVIATTRLGPEQFSASRSSVAFIELGAISLDEGVALIENHQPGECFANAGDRQVSREIVELLEGVTLAVEQVAIHLFTGRSASVVLEELKKRGVGAADGLLDRNPADEHGMQHRLRTMTAVLDTTLEGLDEVSQTALRLAAHLPPETIPLSWVEEMLATAHPEEFEDEFEADRRWLSVKRTLLGRRLLIPTSKLDVARMHRVVGEYARSRDAKIDAWLVVKNHVLGRVGAIDYGSSLSVTECSALVDVAHRILSEDPRFAETLSVGAFLYRTSAYLTDSRVLNLAERILRKLGKTEEPQGRELAIALNNVARLTSSARAGDSLEMYRRSLEICEGLAAGQGKHDRVAQRDLSVAIENLARLTESSQPDNAIEMYRRSLEIRERLAAGQGRHDRVAQRDLSVALTHAARLTEPVRLGEALQMYQRSLAICETLASLEGTQDRVALRDLSVALDNVARLSESSRPGEALEMHRRSIEIREKLIAD